MKSVYKQAGISILLSAVAGLAATALVVKSENGYSAGFVLLFLFFVVGIATLLLFLSGITLLLMGKRMGPGILLASLVLPVSFIGSAIIAKQLELGAYREEPMTPIIPQRSNVVVFKLETTEEQINTFWDKTLSTERQDGRGRDHLPGLRGIARLSDWNGHKALSFSFQERATNEQREYVYSVVRSSSFVFELRENVETNNYLPRSEPSLDDGKPRKEFKNSGSIVANGDQQ